MRKVAIIGAGMMGSALAFPLRENGHIVNLVGTPLDDDIISNCLKENKHLKFDRVFPAGINFFYFKDWLEAVKDVDFVICGVSSFGVDWFLENVLMKLDPSVPVLSVTKGLINKEEGTLISYPDYWEGKLKEKGIIREVCAIGGPCTSYELVFHDHSEVTFCGKNINVLKMMKDAMRTSYYHISLTDDVLGLESAVALKNGYALGIALTIGLSEKENGLDSGLHFNSQAGVFYQAVKEMKALLRIQHASELAECMGIGDLYVTVYGGRTRKIGILLGRGLSYKEAVEELKGVTLESLVVSRRVIEAIKVKASKGIVDLNDFPLLMHIDGVLNKNKSAELPWDDFTFEKFI